MKDKKDIFSSAFIRKFGLPVLAAIFVIASMLAGPREAGEQSGAGSAASSTASETYSESVSSGEATETYSESVAAEAATETDPQSMADSAAAETYSAVNGKTIFAPSSEQQKALRKAEETVSRDGEYSSMAEVAAYIHLYGKLPSNFISKTKAKEQGWVQSEGNLQDVLPGRSIGGSRFYNDEGVLPEENGCEYTECDIDYTGGKRNAKRIVFSDDGHVFYTEDHYETYIQLY